MREPDLTSTSLTDAFISPDEWQAIVCALSLSPRESEVAHFILQGSDEAAIASRLGIAPRTVRAHIEGAYLKAGVHTRSDLVARLFREYVRIRSDARALAGEPMAD